MHITFVSFINDFQSNQEAYGQLGQTLSLTKLGQSCDQFSTSGERETLKTKTNGRIGNLFIY